MRVSIEDNNYNCRHFNSHAITLLSMGHLTPWLFAIRLLSLAIVGRAHKSFAMLHKLCSFIVFHHLTFTPCRCCCRSTTPQYTVRWTRPQLFDEIVVDARMLADHLPDCVQNALNSLLKTVDDSVTIDNVTHGSCTATNRPHSHCIDDTY